MTASELGSRSLADEFNDALAAGTLVIQRCNACGEVNMYPRYRCPACHSADLGWQESEGTGVLLTHAVVRAVPPKGFESDLPYAVGVVRLDEGVQLLARLEPAEDGEWDRYACDTRVRFVPRSRQAEETRLTAWFATDGSPS
jgi:uncharacterized OB-fold protein